MEFVQQATYGFEPRPQTVVIIRQKRKISFLKSIMMIIL